MTQSRDRRNHHFDPMAIPGLSRRARERVNAAFEAMSDWRSEIMDNNKKNFKRVIEKMAVAAAELGLPEQVIDAAGTDLLNLTETQIKAMDQVMEAWQTQLKLPDPALTSAALNKSFGAPGNWSADVFQMGVTPPLQFWISSAQQWQKSWTDMMTSWTEGGKSSRGGRRD